MIHLLVYQYKLSFAQNIHFLITKPFKNLSRREKPGLDQPIVWSTKSISLARNFRVIR